MPHLYYLRCEDRGFQRLAPLTFPWYKEWTGVAVRDRAENIEHVYRELGGK